MASSLSSIGVGSGLPLDTLLQQLRTAENAPLAAIQTRANKEQQRLSAYGTLKSALDAVSTAAATLGKSETFHGVKASVTGESFTATAKADSGAIPGNYSIKVESLATAQVLAADGVASRSERLAGSGTGNLEITFTLENGDTHTLSIDAAKSSLEDVVKAINADSKLGVSATILNDGDADNPYRLMLSADKTGVQNSIASISVNAAEGSTATVGNLASVLSYGAGEPGMQQITAASDAKVTINGLIEVSSDSNTLENVIDGVTLNLTKAVGADGTADTLKITRDDSVATTAVNNFVNAYNALQSTIKSLTSYDIDAQQGAALTGDSLARNAQSRVRDALNGLAVNGVTLASIGIKTDPVTGNLSVDSTKLNDALKNNRAEIEQLFSGENGLSKRITESVEVFTKSDGLIKTSQDSITRTLKLLEGQYDQMEARIDQKMETYRLQFVQLDSMMAQMSGISSYLSTQLSMLENLAGSNSKKS
ncbi:MAG TPA: flagellar filament capping protein FliD [Burkholderiaceae bacterium]|nr:flagellar filament capping protein FliD [Burkholderiaceae bacterium]